MKTIQGMIAQYFIMNNNTQYIEFVSSINKLKKNNNNKDKKCIPGEVVNQIQIENNDNSNGNSNSIISNSIISNNDYKSRKKQGIVKCLEILTQEHSFNNMLLFFNNHKKKDDLADCFLQGLWFINNKHI